jgi:hypothetical protein
VNYSLNGMGIRGCAFACPQVRLSQLSTIRSGM